MQVLQGSWEFLKELMSHGVYFLVGASSIEIVDDREHCLVLRSGSRTCIADARTQTIRIGSRVAASFGAIRSVDIRHQTRREGEAERWIVSLSLGWPRSVAIGQSLDDAEASMAAARLSSITGKKVLAY
jgi:hypothetical protein